MLLCKEDENTGRQDVIQSQINYLLTTGLHFSDEELERQCVYADNFHKKNCNKVSSFSREELEAWCKYAMEFKEKHTDNSAYEKFNDDFHKLMDWVQVIHNRFEFLESHLEKIEAMLKPKKTKKQPK